MINAGERGIIISRSLSRCVKHVKRTSLSDIVSHKEVRTYTTKCIDSTTFKGAVLIISAWLCEQLPDNDIIVISLRLAELWPCLQSTGISNDNEHRG